MPDIARRNLLLGLGAAIAAPAVIRTPGLLMPVRSLAPTDYITITGGTINNHAISGPLFSFRFCDEAGLWKCTNVQLPSEREKYLQPPSNFPKDQYWLALNWNAVHPHISDVATAA